MISNTCRTRCRLPDSTLIYAREWADAAGISEVTDITHLDDLGVSVFVGVRPHSLADTYTYGKGRLPIDAEVGAYMEAIEYYFAEPGAGLVSTRWGSSRDVAGAAQSDDAILDFVPLLDRVIDLDARLLLASAENVETGEACLIPAELAFYPAPDVGQSLFGSSTNGLASGNSVLEASVSALAELIERDIWSFEFIRDSSMLVEPAGLPDEVRDIVARAEAIGLQLKIRTLPNEFDIPFFSAFLFDPDNLSRKFFNGGWGCHLDRSIAVMKAVTEVIQSRLAFIHGGRGARFSPSANADEIALLKRDAERVSNSGSVTNFVDVPNRSVPQGSLRQQFGALIDCLRRVTDKPIYRSVFTPADAALHVVRLVVPSLENFKETKIRVGRRLKNAIDGDGGERGRRSRGARLSSL